MRVCHRIWRLSGRRAVFFGLLLLSPLAVSAAGALSPTGGVILAGTKWETPYYVVNSGTPGPTVLVTAGIHGNEPAGPRAAEQIRHWPLVKGRLVVIPRCNVPGLKADKRALPEAPAGQGDLNRNFPPSNGVDNARGPAAEALWRFVSDLKPDYLLDLHEGYGTRGAGSKSVGSSIIRVPQAQSQALQTLMLDAVNAEIPAGSNRFVALHGAAQGSLAHACGDRGICAFICETTSRDQPLALRLRQHRTMVHALLARLGMTGADCNRMVPERERGRSGVYVAVYNGPGAGSPDKFLDVLTSNRDLFAQPIHPADIREGALRQFDVVLFPGGSGSKQAEALAATGRDAVTEFVKTGGGYIGICAGAYLGTSHYAWSLRVINAASLDTKHWRRGNGAVRLELTPSGQELFRHAGSKDPDIEFRQGPILGPGAHPDLPAYEVLAWYRSGVGTNGADPKTMVDTPAIVRGEFGRGRVLLVSPHPEMTKGLGEWVPLAVRWCAGGVHAEKTKGSGVGGQGSGYELASVYAWSGKRPATPPAQASGWRAELREAAVAADRVLCDGLAELAPPGARPGFWAGRVAEKSRVHPRPSVVEIASGRPSSTGP